MTSPVTSPYPATMRTLPLLALLAACSASGPSGPVPSNDAAADSPTGDTFPCALGREVLLNGRCVGGTPDNCNGVRCPGRQVCLGTSDADGGDVLICAPQP